jgi:hypothetical protein
MRRYADNNKMKFWGSTFSWAQHLQDSNRIWRWLRLPKQQGMSWISENPFSQVLTYCSVIYGNNHQHTAFSIYGSSRPWPLFQFFNPYTIGRTPWTGDQTVASPLPTHRTTQTQNKRTQTSMPSVGFVPTIPVFERVRGHCDGLPTDL